MSKADSTSPTARKTSVSSQDSVGTRKTTFDLEPNPFEQSFAAPDDDKKRHGAPRLSHSRNASMDNNPHKSPKLTPLARVFTPGGNRILPPLSEIAQSGSGTNTPSAGISGFETGPLSPAIFLQKPQNGGTPAGFPGWNAGTPGAQSPGAFSSLVSSLRHRSFAESGIRSGLTPGGQLTPISAAAAVAAQQDGKTTPGGLSALFNLDTPEEQKAKPVPAQTAPAQTVPSQQPPQGAQAAQPPQPSQGVQAAAAAASTAPAAKGKKGGKKREKKDKTSPDEPKEPLPPAKKRKKTKTEIKQEEEEAAAMAASETGPDGEPMDEEEKRKCFLERNRVAALKCRQRKKQWLANLEAKVEFYASENDNLNQQIARLRDQVKGLKSIVLDFKNGNGAKIPAATLDEVLNTNIVINNVPAPVPIPQVPTIPQPGVQQVQQMPPQQQVPQQQVPQQQMAQQQMAQQQMAQQQMSQQQVPPQQQVPQQQQQQQMPPQQVPQQMSQQVPQQVPQQQQMPLDGMQNVPQNAHANHHQPMMMGQPIEHGPVGGAQDGTQMMGIAMQAGGMMPPPNPEEGDRQQGIPQPLYM
ncbi:YALIA101S04e07624g1_1 [Yarrowia lipolytica]|nr:Transcription factor atf1 [Yarrowia lipolytica]SEI33992.1 YALIA101S04e07624g1_1 [Yarrowia lipolytica]